MIHRYSDNRNRIGEEATQKMRIKKIGDKEKDMPLGGNFRVLFDEWIREIGVVFCKQEEPPEKEIGDGSIIAYFLWYHIF